MTKIDARRKSCWPYPARQWETAAQMRWAGPCDCVADHRKGQRLTLGGCKAPSRGEGRALPGLSAGVKAN